MTVTRRSFIKHAAGAASLAGLSSAVPADIYSAPGGTMWNPPVGEHIWSLDDSIFRWMAQIGLKHVVLNCSPGLVDRDNKGYWALDDIRVIQKKCESFGLVLASLNIHKEWTCNNTLGKPGRDEEIERIVKSVKAAGEAGIPFLQWAPTWLNHFSSKETGIASVSGRGGAVYWSFDYNRVKDLPPLPPFEDIGEVTREELWERMLYIGKPVVDAAEKAGIKLSMHPNDPPVPVIRGVARIFTSLADAERLLKEFPSPAFGITFCMGVFSEMGEDVVKCIHRLGNRIHFVHFRAVRGTVPYYEEVFIDETKVDMFSAMKALKDIGYSGTIISDHTPTITGDINNFIGFSYSHGFIRALIQAVNNVA